MDETHALVPSIKAFDAGVNRKNNYRGSFHSRTDVLLQETENSILIKQANVLGEMWIEDRETIMSWWSINLAEKVGSVLWRSSGSVTFYVFCRRSREIKMRNLMLIAAAEAESSPVFVLAECIIRFLTLTLNPTSRLWWASQCVNLPFSSNVGLPLT